jgi:site-specific recombinase XerC
VRCGDERLDASIALHASRIRRMLFDWLVVSQVIAMNPAAAVRDPKYVVRRGKTPVLSPEQARKLLDSIRTDTIVGLRDRAIVGVYSFARVSAVVRMKIGSNSNVGTKTRHRILPNTFPFLRLLRFGDSQKKAQFAALFLVV